MPFNRMGVPKFHIDAALLARQWGMIEAESGEGKFFLNPSKVTSLNFNYDGIDYITLKFKQQYWINSLDHVFILGHNWKSTDITMKYTFRDAASGNAISPIGNIPFNDEATNGWHYFSHSLHAGYYVYLYFKLYNTSGTSVNINNARLGDISVGWSYEMQHSSDLELTLNYSNESIKTQTTLGGHTLTNAGYNHKPGWIKPAWTTGANDNSFFEDQNFKVFPVGRRSWNLKFSYLADEHSTSPLFAEDPYSNYGIFENTGSIIDDEEEGTIFEIKKDFLSKVWFSTNCGQLPFIFQPNKDVEDEFAICRIDSDTASFEQVANNVYNISLDIVEVW